MKLLTQRPPHPTVSPSQLKTWHSCQRLWGFQHINHIRSPSTDSQRLGTRVHAILEEWLTLGTVPDMDEAFGIIKGLRYPGRIAAAGLSLLPAPPQVDVEEEFFIEVEPGVVLHGFIDLRRDNEVMDHKTTGDFKWMMSAEEMDDDEQAIVYAVRALLTPAEYHAVRTSWVYYRTVGTPEARKVTRTHSKVALLNRLEAVILPRAREILQARTLSSAMELPTNPSHCGAYGGCPHSDRCAISPQESFLEAMDARDFINQQNAKGKAPAAPPAPAPAPAAPAAPPAPPVAPMTESISGGIPPGAVTTNVVTTTPPAAPAPPAAFDPNDLTTWERPQLKTKAVELGLISASSRVGAPKLRELIGEALRAEAPPEAPQAPAVETVAASPAIVTDPGPGNYQVTVPPGAVVEHGDIHVEPPPVPQESKEILNGYPIGILYVDCLPVGPEAGVTTKLSSIIAEALDQEGLNDDYRLEERLGFGKAAGFLSTIVARTIGQGPLDVSCSTRLPEHRDCLAMLEGMAAHVIKGV